MFFRKPENALLHASQAAGCCAVEVFLCCRSVRVGFFGLGLHHKSSVAVLKGSLENAGNNPRKWSFLLAHGDSPGISCHMDFHP